MSVSIPPKTAGAPQRIAKLLARAGIASRREIERMIAEGRVALNGTVLDTPATLLGSLHGVTVDGEPVAAATPARLFRYHKAAGLLTAERDFTGRPTIYDQLPEGLPRVIPVGRLDLNTEGLLLLTTDGELKRELELPSTGVERSYRARAYGQVSQEQLEDLMLGIEIEGVRYGPINANIERRTGANLWIEMTLTEGKNREVRRVLEYLGLQVSRLIRTRYGPFYLGDLPSGDVDEIRQNDLVTFRTVLSKPGGGKAASNLQFSVRQRVIEPVEKASKVEPEGRRRIAKPAAAPVAKGPVFTARATPEAKPKPGTRTTGQLSARVGASDRVANPARAGRAKAFRDTRAPREADRAERPWASRAGRDTGTADDRPRGGRSQRDGGGDSPRGRRPFEGEERPRGFRSQRGGDGDGRREGGSGRPGTDRAERSRAAVSQRYGESESPRGPRAARPGFEGTERPRGGPRPPRPGFEGTERPRGGPRPARPGFEGAERPRGGPRPARPGFEGGERPRGGPRPARPGGSDHPRGPRPGGGKPSRPPRGRG